MRNKHLVLRRGLPVAGALAALAIGAPSASAADFGAGSFSFTKTSAFRQVRLAPTAGATGNSRSITLPIQTGQSTLNQSNSGSFQLAGGFRMRGRRSLTATNCTVNLAGNAARLSCRVGGSTRQLFVMDTRGGKISPSADFSQLAGTAIATRLTRASARFLNSRLRLSRASVARVNHRRVVARSALTATRFITTTSGENRVFYDQRFVSALRRCRVRVEAVAPATAIPPSGNAPEGGANLPVRTGVAVNAQTLGQVPTDGGTVLVRDDDPTTPQNETFRSELTNITTDLSTTPPAVTAFSSRLNQTVPIGSLSNASVNKQLTSDGGSVAADGTLELSEVASTVLASDTRVQGNPSAECVINRAAGEHNVGRVEGSTAFS